MQKVTWVVKTQKMMKGKGEKMQKYAILVQHFNNHLVKGWTSSYYTHEHTQGATEATAELHV